jgi:2,4-dienoyl-CoA reductase-like NADH-dependent reductase (Old Yellow Enzyme family)
MSILFEPFKIGNVVLRNRFIRSATTSAYSKPNGVLRPQIIDLYRRLAEGEVGLILKGHLYVLETGRAFVGQAGIDSEAQLPMLKTLTETVHHLGGVIVAQLNHAGINSEIERAGPSEYDGSTRSLEMVKARALTSDEIWDIVEAFGEGADRAMEAGFDGVQIHGAHLPVPLQIAQQTERRMGRGSREKDESVERDLRWN